VCQPRDRTSPIITGTDRVARTFNIGEAKTHFSKLLEAVESGEEIIIARSGKPIARMSAVPPETHQKKRKPGFAKGLIPDSRV